MSTKEISFQAINKARSEGTKAGKEGKSLSSNPYCSNTDEHMQWMKGWSEGRRSITKK